MIKFLKNSKIIKRISVKNRKQIELIKEVINIIRKREVRLLPPYITFFILLSFIPTLTLVFEVIFLTVKSNKEILLTLKDVLPSNVYTSLVLLMDHNSNHISLFTVSNVILLYIASKLYFSFYRSYIIIYNIKVRRHYIKDRIVSIINTLLLIVLIFLLTILTIFNTYIYHIIEDVIIKIKIVNYIYNYVNLILAIIIICSIVTFMMYSIPDFRQRVKDVFLGALFVTLGWIFVSFIFKIYTDNYANYQNVYKTFASIIVFITWIYLISYVLILGIAINKAKSKISTYENI